MLPAKAYVASPDKRKSAALAAAKAAAEAWELEKDQLNEFIVLADVDVVAAASNASEASAAWDLEKAISKVI